MKDPARREYVGARGARFALFPSSDLARKQPAWVMVAEMFETSRLWGLNAARDPAAVDRAAAPGTWSSAATTSRAGTASAAPSSRPSA